MKTAFVEVSETRKRLDVEIPSSVVDAEIDRVTRDYGRAARVPGFRPGKVPARVVKQRFRQQILHDVAHDLVPRAVDEALAAHGVEPVEAPDIRDVAVDEGQPLRFTALFETVPRVDPGDYGAIALRRSPAVLDRDAVDGALTRLRERLARVEPVEDRGLEMGDLVTADVTRRPEAGGGPEAHEDVTIELGAADNPPGLDAELLGLRPGASKSFVLRAPDSASPGRGSPESWRTRPSDDDTADGEVAYTVAVKAIRRRVLPELDDELAKDLEMDSLAALRDRVRQDLLREADLRADRDLRHDLLKELAGRMTSEVPQTLVEREMDRRAQELAQRLVAQRIDPQRANIDWSEVRESQRASARETVKSALVLDEIGRREALAVSAEDEDRELAAYAARAGRTPAAVKAALEKDGGFARWRAGLRREKTIAFLLSRARIERE